MKSPTTLVCGQTFLFIALLLSSTVWAGPVDSASLSRRNLIDQAKMDLEAKAESINSFGGSALNEPGNIQISTSNCNESQLSVVTDAWANAKLLANAHWFWKPNVQYQAAQDAYLGNGSLTEPWFDRIYYNMKRQYNIHNGRAPILTYGNFYCDEEALEWSHCDGANAYTWDVSRWWWTSHYVVLCPSFFANQEYYSLGQIIARGNADPSTRSVLDNFIGSPGSTLFHETYHWANTVSQPRTNVPTDMYPEVYEPQLVWDLARTGNSGGASMNAQSYSFAALAMLVQIFWDMPEPPLPAAVVPTNKPFPPDGGLVKAGLNHPPAPAIPPPIMPAKGFVSHLDGPPPGWIDPDTGKNGSASGAVKAGLEMDPPKHGPNLTGWTQLTPSKGHGLWH